MNMNKSRSISNEGIKLYREERYEEAAAKFAEAQALFASENNVKEMAEAANNRGVCWRQAANWSEAHIAFKEARDAFHSIDDLAGEGQVVGNLGALVASEEQPQQAAKYYEEAIELLEAAGEQDLAQATYAALSRLRLKEGNWLGAINAYETGLSQVERPGMFQRALRRVLGVPRKMSGG